MPNDPTLNYIMEILTAPTEIDIQPPVCVGCEAEVSHVNGTSHLCDGCEEQWRKVCGENEEPLSNDEKAALARELYRDDPVMMMLDE